MVNLVVSPECVVPDALHTAGPVVVRVPSGGEEVAMVTGKWKESNPHVCQNSQRGRPVSQALF